MVLASVSLIGSTVEGKIVSISVEAENIVRIQVEKSSNGVIWKGKVLGNTETQKAILAAALTAKASNADVLMNKEDFSGENGWTLITVK